MISVPVALDSLPHPSVRKILKLCNQNVCDTPWLYIHTWARSMWISTQVCGIMIINYITSIISFEIYSLYKILFMCLLLFSYWCTFFARVHIYICVYLYIYIFRPPFFKQPRPFSKMSPNALWRNVTIYRKCIFQ